MAFWQRLRDDEEGLETLQTVMIVAVAAIILALLKETWPRIKGWFRSSVQQVIN
jgi:hypothetical protein